MKELAVQIVRFVASHQPGWVECEFVDAEGHTHRFIDKVPIFTVDDLDERSQYPQPGVVGCEIISEWNDEFGQNLARITTERPDSVESTEGSSEFVVLASQIVDYPPC